MRIPPRGILPSGFGIVLFCSLTESMLKMTGRSLCRSILPAILLLAAHIASGQQRNHGIGLTLSGGGAKGLAHIGILKAIDSAGLNIDYVTGTSMGSIAGGLYAAGYSGNDIERIAREIRWDDLLSNTISMRNYIMEEKSEFGKYMIELSVEKGKLGIPSGFLESQELWLTLEKYFFPVAGVRDFDRLSIPFACVAVDLLSTEPYAHRSGSIVQSIRSSMAIPGVFSPVDINGRRYVDGGIIRNLPVQECRELGAKHVIAVSVSTPAGSLEDLDNAVKVLGQVVFLNEAKDSREQAKLSDRFVQIPMGKYGSGSFSSAEEIIDLGIREGRKLYPMFKSMADSLRQLDPSYAFRKDRLPATREYLVSDLVVEGLRGKDSLNFHRQIEGLTGNTIGHRKLENNSRDAFAHRTYKSIAYDIRPAGDSTWQLAYKVKPESATMLKLGLNENSFTGFGVHVNLTTRNFLLPASRTMLSLNLGDNLRLLFEHMQLLGYRNPWSNRFRIHAENQELSVFTDFRKTGAYKYNYLTFDDRFQRSARRRTSAGFGFQWESVSASPRIRSGTYYDGRNHFMQPYAFWQYNDLTRPQYPLKGTVAELKLGYVFGLDPRVKIYQDGQFVGDLSPQTINYGNYLRFEGSFSNTAPVASRWSWVTKLQAGVNFSDRVSVFNNFLAGGMNNTMRNQMPFAGLLEGEVVSESMASAQTGPRLKPFGNFHITLLGGMLVYDFVRKSNLGKGTSTVAGGSVTFAYLTPIGPAELSFMASDRTDGVRVYFNFGFPFK